MGIKKTTGSTLNRICLDYLASQGITAWRTNNAGTWDNAKKVFRTFHGRKGVPDIIGIFSQKVLLTDASWWVFGTFLGVETKTPNDRLSVDQKMFREDVEKAGGCYVVVRKLEDLIAAIDKLRSQF